MSPARGWVVLVRLLVVIGLVAGSTLLLGGTATAQLPGGEDCRDTPAPEVPGTGILGLLDPGAVQTPDDGSSYSRYAYAGLDWHTYDLGCANVDPIPGATTWAAGRLFTIAKAEVAAANYLHAQISTVGEPNDDGEAGSALSELDSVLTPITTSLRDTFFTPFAALALSVVAVLVLLRARRQDTAYAAQMTGAALVTAGLVAFSVAAPQMLGQWADATLGSTAREIESGLSQALGVDSDTGRRDVLMAQLERVWAGGEFASPDTLRDPGDLAKLRNAQAFTNAEVAEIASTPPDGSLPAPGALFPGPYNELAGAKSEDFQEIYQSLQDADPASVGIFQGRDTARLGAAVEGVVVLTPAALFGAIADLFLFVCLLVLRLLVMFLPVLAPAMLIHPKLFGVLGKVAGTALIGALAGAVVSGVHGVLMVRLLEPESGMARIVAIVVLSLISIILWKVLKPLGQMKALVGVATSRPVKASTSRAGALLGRSRDAAAEGLRRAPTAVKQYATDAYGRYRNVGTSPPPGDRSGTAPGSATPTAGSEFASKASLAKNGTRAATALTGVGAVVAAGSIAGQAHQRRQRAAAARSDDPPPRTAPPAVAAARMRPTLPPPRTTPPAVAAGMRPTLSPPRTARPIPSGSTPATPAAPAPSVVGVLGHRLRPGVPTVTEHPHVVDQQGRSVGGELYNPTAPPRPARVVETVDGGVVHEIYTPDERPPR